MIVDRDIPFIRRGKIITYIRRRLAKSKVPNDIIVRSISAIDSRKGDVGYLSYYVLKEGIEVL